MARACQLGFQTPRMNLAPSETPPQPDLTPAGGQWLAHSETTPSLLTAFKPHVGGGPQASPHSADEALKLRAVPASGDSRESLPERGCASHTPEQAKHVQPTYQRGRVTPDIVTAPSAPSACMGTGVSVILNSTSPYLLEVSNIQLVCFNEHYM